MPYLWDINKTNLAKKKNMDYEELAIDQFYKLKEETLDRDRKVLGAKNEVKYHNENTAFTIKVDGYWEKSTWFKYKVYDENGNEIASGVSD